MVKVKYVGTGIGFINLGYNKQFTFDGSNKFTLEVSYDDFYQIIRSKVGQFFKLADDPMASDDKKSKAPTIMNLGDVGVVENQIVEIKNEGKTKVLNVDEVVDEIASLDSIDEQLLSDTVQEIKAIDNATLTKATKKK